jgi:hypothetical protein
VSTDRPNPWSFEPEKLAEALDRFNAKHPDEHTRRAVYDWLIACYGNPLRGGDESPPGSGIFYARVPATDVAVLYTVYPDTGMVLVITIAEAAADR